MNVTPLLEVLAEVSAERARQDARFGEQNPMNGTGPSGDSVLALHRARRHFLVAECEGYLAWRHILEEEVCEAFVEEDPIRLREELIQVAAVAVAWVEAIDRKAAKGEAGGS